MKVFQLLFFVALCTFVYTPAEAIHRVKAPTATETADKAKADAEAAIKKHQEEWNQLSRQEKRAKRKELRSELKSAIKEAKKVDASDDLVLLVILAILIPPLAMALYDGISTRFWISLLLTLLFFLPGMIYTLVVILGDN